MSITFSIANTDDERYELNLANRNAYLVLAIIHEGRTEPIGQWDCKDLENIVEIITTSIKSDLSQWAQPTEQVANFISFGISEEDLKVRLRRLRWIVQNAIQLQQPVRWS